MRPQRPLIRRSCQLPRVASLAHPPSLKNSLSRLLTRPRVRSLPRKTWHQSKRLRSPGSRRRMRSWCKRRSSLRHQRITWLVRRCYSSWVSWWWRWQQPPLLWACLTRSEESRLSWKHSEKQETRLPDLKASYRRASQRGRPQRWHMRWRTGSKEKR